jgi:hypothetical protein
MKHWIIAVALFVCWSDAAAAALACRSSPGTDDYYQYRLIDGRKCWYRGHTVLEKSALAWKESQSSRGGMVKRAAEQPSLKRQGANGFAPTLTEVAASPREAPDFDSVFGHFPTYAVARPVVHLLYPTRVSQAWGARPVATIAYRVAP